MMKNMFDGKQLINRFFRPVDNVVWDLMTGRVGIRGKDCIYTVEGEGDSAQVVENMFDMFGMEVPAFAQNTPVADVKIGDLVYGSDDLVGWVVAINDKSFNIMKRNGQVTVWRTPKTQMLGFDGGVMVLRSLLNMFPDGKSSLNNIQGMLLPMMMMGGGDFDMSSMMPMMLMSQMGSVVPTADGEASNPMSGIQNMMPMMLMMQMMKSGSSSKPSTMNNFFDRT